MRVTWITAVNSERWWNTGGFYLLFFIRIKLVWGMLKTNEWTLHLITCKWFLYYGFLERRDILHLWERKYGHFPSSRKWNVFLLLKKYIYIEMKSRLSFLFFLTQTKIWMNALGFFLGFFFTSFYFLQRIMSRNINKSKSKKNQTLIFWSSEASHHPSLIIFPQHHDVFMFYCIPYSLYRITLAGLFKVRLHHFSFLCHVFISINY